MNDPVSHPAHYTSDPSGVECIQITRHRSYAIGNAIKYLWRAGLKESDDPFAKQIEDLEKARWYIANEIDRLTTMHTKRAAHRLTEPAVDRYFNGGETMADKVAQNEKLRATVNDEAHAGLVHGNDETFPERLARIVQRSTNKRLVAVDERVELNREQLKAINEGREFTYTAEQVQRLGQAGLGFLKGHAAAVLVEHTGPYRSNVTYLHPIDDPEGGAA